MALESTNGTEVACTHKYFLTALDKCGNIGLNISSSNMYNHLVLWPTPTKRVPYVLAQFYKQLRIVIYIPLYIVYSFSDQFKFFQKFIYNFNILPVLIRTGITNIIIHLIFLSYGILLAGINLVILAYSFTMPWTHCSNSWNTAECKLYTHSDSDSTNETTYLDPIYSDINFTTPDDEFSWNLLKGLDSGFMWWLALATIIVWILVYLVAVNGIRVMGKVALWTMLFRVGTTVVLLIVGLATVLQQGGIYGLHIYFLPGFDSRVDVWRDAAGLVLFQHLMGAGIVTTLGSYDKLQNNCLFDALIVAIFNFIYPFIYSIFYMIFAGFLKEIME
ncbi:unnamed protein product, partial [Meganyctiphanes norvegica]